MKPLMALIALRRTLGRSSHTVSASGTVKTIDIELGSPTVTSPIGSPPDWRTAFAALCNAFVISRACESSTSPDCVKDTPREERSKSFTSSSRSRDRTCCDSEGCATFTRCAAADSEPSSAMAMK